MTPLDAHAHVPLGASVGEITGYAPSLVMAVTGSPAHWSTALRRHDPCVAWGIGCHPGDEGALRNFDEGRFARAAKTAAFVGEVGLDARSRAPRKIQDAVLDAVLRVAAGEGLIVSVHSVGRSKETLDLVARHPAARVVLHWWTGPPDETAKAVQLGCYFSLNGAARPYVLAAVPPERALTETDYPFTKRVDTAASLPGRVAKSIALLSSAWNVPPEQVATRVWQNVVALDAAGRLRERVGSFARASSAAERIASRTAAPLPT